MMRHVKCTMECLALKMLAFAVTMSKSGVPTSRIARWIMEVREYSPTHEIGDPIKESSAGKVRLTKLHIFLSRRPASISNWRPAFIPKSNDGCSLARSLSQLHRI
jgi:hypothetical protein